MTTHSWSSPALNWLDDNTGAQFRELSEAFALVGLVKTADTGQVNWGTLTWVPTAGQQVAGYEIWRFNDALQATKPLFLKIEYGSNPHTGSTAANDSVGMWITVGTGSSGAGAITGELSSRKAFAGGYGSTSSSTNLAPLASYLSLNPNALSLAFKTGGVNSGSGFVLARQTDIAGAIEGNGGIFMITGNTENAAFSTVVNQHDNSQYRYVGAASACFVPLDSSVAIGGVEQVFPHWTVAPEPIPQVASCTVVASAFLVGNTFLTTLVGTTPRTYISVGLSLGYGSSFSSSSRGIAFLWE